jgi:hypothetical protein
MDLQTQIPLTPKNPSIDYHSKILLLGSCFVEHIGAKLEDNKFNHHLNPFGIFFHPTAIENVIIRAVKDNYFSGEDLYWFDDRWICFEVQSKKRETSKEKLLGSLNGLLSEFKGYLSDATHILLTFGTAWVYRFNENNLPVTNCYKLPQSNFFKELLSVDTVERSISNTIDHIQKVNPDATFITTVSPIRHIKDGFVQNNRSKAHLLTSINSIVEKMKKVHYFPSYEIMMDELRDYRFYESDMIHPNETAISIIWDRFTKVWISESTNDLRKEIQSIQSALNHRPLDTSSKQHGQFIEKLDLRISSLQEQFPFIKF